MYFKFEMFTSNTGPVSPQLCSNWINICLFRPLQNICKADALERRDRLQESKVICGEADTVAWVSERNIKMLNLFSLKEKKEEGAKSGAGNKKKASAAQLRITKVKLPEPLLIYSSLMP